MIARFLRSSFFGWCTLVAWLVCAYTVYMGWKIRHDIDTCVEIGGGVRPVWVLGQGSRIVCVDPVYWP